MWQSKTNVTAKHRGTQKVKKGQFLMGHNKAMGKFLTENGFSRAAKNSYATQGQEKKKKRSSLFDIIIVI